MAITSDQKYRSFLAELSQVNDLIDRENFAEARAMGLKLRGAAAAAGIRSFHLQWSLAIACDYLGDFEMAFEAIREAVALDPLAIPGWKSFGIIVDHMRTALASPERAPDDGTTPRLYALLVSANEASIGCHLAMARYLQHTGHIEDARRILEAVTTLNPASAEAWLQLARVARAQGDADQARQAEMQATGLADGPALPFGHPGIARA